MTFNKCSIKGKVYGNVPESQQGGASSETDEVTFCFYIIIKRIFIRRYMKLGFPQYKNPFSTLKTKKTNQKTVPNIFKNFEQFFANTYLCSKKFRMQIENLVKTQFILFKISICEMLDSQLSTVERTLRPIFASH